MSNMQQPATQQQSQLEEEEPGGSSMFDVVAAADVQPTVTADVQPAGRVDDAELLPMPPDVDDDDRDEDNDDFAYLHHGAWGDGDAEGLDEDVLAGGSQTEPRPGLVVDELLAGSQTEPRPGQAAAAAQLPMDEVVVPEPVAEFNTAGGPGETPHASQAVVKNSRSAPAAVGQLHPPPSQYAMSLPHYKAIIDEETTIPHSQIMTLTKDRSSLMRDRTKTAARAHESPALKERRRRQEAIMSAAAAGQLLPFLPPGSGATAEAVVRRNLHLTSLLQEGACKELEDIYIFVLRGGAPAVAAEEADEEQQQGGAMQQQEEAGGSRVLMAATCVAPAASPAARREGRSGARAAVASGSDGSGADEEGGDVEMHDAGPSDMGLEEAHGGPSWGLAPAGNNDDDEGISGDPDPYQEGHLYVFHESRREEEEEGEEGPGGSASAIDGDVGFTARTKALVRQLEALLRRGGDGAASQQQQRKRPRLDGVTGAGAEDEAAVGVGDAVTSVSFLTHLLPTEQRERRSPAAKAAAQQMQRRQAAQTFYDLLVLQNRGYVRLDQSAGAYEDLEITPRGPMLGPSI